MDGVRAAMRRKLIGLLFHSLMLIRRSTVRKNVELSTIINDVSKQEGSRRAHLLLLDTNIGIEVFALLKSLSSKFRRTIIMVTRSQEHAEK